MPGRAGFPESKELQGESPVEECLHALGETHNESVYAAIERLVLAGEQVGFTVHDLIGMLKDGMSLEGLLDLIEIRMTGMCLHNESGVA